MRGCCWNGVKGLVNKGSFLLHGGSVRLPNQNYPSASASFAIMDCAARQNLDTAPIEVNCVLGRDYPILKLIFNLPTLVSSFTDTLHFSSSVQERFNL